MQKIRIGHRAIFRDKANQLFQTSFPVFAILAHIFFSGHAF